MEYVGWLDYLICVANLVIPGCISLYFGVARERKARSPRRQYLGLFPVVMSMCASSLSAVAMIGVPSDAYLNGINFYVYIAMCDIVGLVLSYFCFVPVLYNIEIDSAYEYFELRFDSRIRKLASFIYVIIQITYAGIAVYPAASIVSRFLGASFDASAHGLIIFSAFCTLIGGFRGVVWADTFQAVVMWIFLVVFLVMTTFAGGGPARIYELSKETNRLDIFVMDLDPTIRLSFWSGLFGIVTQSFITTILNPSFFQRLFCLKTETRSHWATFLNKIQINSVNLILAYCGLAMFAAYYGCDPKSAGLVDNYLNYVDYFIGEASKTSMGLRSLLISAILSASLSTMSTNMNTAATILYSEFIRNRPLESHLTEVSAIRLLTGLVALSSMGFVFLIKGTNSIIDVFQVFITSTNSLIFGLFILGMFCLNANSKGTLWGGIVSFCIIMTLAVGSRLYASDWKQAMHRAITVDKCPFNSTMPPPVIASWPRSGSLPPWVFRITHNYYPLIAWSSTVTLGVIFSYFARDTARVKPRKELFCPWVGRLLEEKFYQDVPLCENTNKN